ncbi:Peptidyl-prolyl cis-trans isomerase FKBP62 [Galdieria sulphuraria]|uniref:peptidylprolyl isomerase n=1 Tax=Galdieria sulphuraria TaxID=130081 RepID=M2W1R3_GALSU|nr:peptidylprolyl isomerase [Galdieria sulphuraria]EME29616.1 peptidylprolyl isomerase [Galdieria sulphuraria]GJD12789.1 Peptidyl-prolyl cis-trans isomerase FKBP62 [Galdieria sulphuraria]|eukprot:XP_005706136.1 peptidylprolyl isomerase [Galdieria sulphuraria]
MRSECYHNLTLDGGVKKRVLTEGSGTPPQANQRVWIHYVGKLENGEIFDSSRERGQPLSFRLGKRSVILGLEILVATMKVGEVCAASLTPEYAFGSEGRRKRQMTLQKNSKKDRNKKHYCVPPNANVFFEVELMELAALTPEKALQSLSPEEKLRKAAELKDRGNSYYKELKFILSRECYEEAIRILEYFWHPKNDSKHQTNGYDDADKWNEKNIQDEVNSMKVAILSNIALTYFKQDRFQQAEQYATATLKLDSNNVKALFCRGRARMQLAELQSAKEDLLQAAKLQPQNKDIRRELDELQKKLVKYGKQEKATYRAMFE